MKPRSGSATRCAIERTTDICLTTRAERLPLTISIPVPALPDTRLRSEPLSPPITLRPPEIRMPAPPLPRATLPDLSVPMRQPVTRTALASMRMPSPAKRLITSARIFDSADDTVRPAAWPALAPSISTSGTPA